ncbi:rhodanese-like domain-containing protein [Terrabacter sp. NPDC080008]|uniref:rhodanese-like domain-containing protein n=1 Tax=Terrabacter sp. NPDC080008 TaxID=3155176 RepID=UPI00344F2EE8
MTGPSTRPAAAPACGAATGTPGRLEEMLEAARASLQRLTPTQAREEQLRGALLVDTRTAAQRARQGDLPGAVVIDRTVLEWRLDPAGPHRIPEVDAPGLRVVVVCRQGYSSSLAARSLQQLGLDATDVIGGVEAWLAAGLPLAQGPADVRE